LRKNLAAPTIVGIKQVGIIATAENKLSVILTIKIPVRPPGPLPVFDLKGGQTMITTAWA
jgi:hypothetical protein